MDRIVRCAIVLLAGGLLAGCQDNRDPLDFGIRQEGDLETQSPAYIRQERMSPILGDTTGAGLQYDRNTGGELDGNNLTPAQRLKLLERRSVLPPPPLSAPPGEAVPPEPAGSGGTGEGGPYSR